MEGIFAIHTIIKKSNLNFNFLKKEPMEGWVDSLNGPIGIMVAGGKGVMRSMLCEAEFTAEVIPVDQAIAGLIAIAYTVANSKQK